MHYAQRRSPSSNAVGIGLIALLHLGVGYALITGLGSQLKRVIPTQTVVTLFEEKKVEEPLPTLKQVELPKTDKIFVPMPDVKIDYPATASPVSRSTDIVPDNREVTLARLTPPTQADTAAGAKRLDGPPLVYPTRLEIAGLEGWVDVQCDVDETGRTSGCAMIAHQGSNLFVEAALAYVIGTHYTPATHNGAAVTEPHHRFHIEFKLKN